MKKLIIIILFSCTQQKVEPKFCWDCVNISLTQIEPNHANVSEMHIRICDHSENDIEKYINDNEVNVGTQYSKTKCVKANERN